MLLSFILSFSMNADRRRTSWPSREAPVLLVIPRRSCAIVAVAPPVQLQQRLHRLARIPP
jgi:hypothetical protein